MAARGNSRAYALRKLAQERPDLHALVLAGELTAHRAMIAAGLRRPTMTVPADPEELGAALAERLDEDKLERFLEALRRALNGLEEEPGLSARDARIDLRHGTPRRSVTCPEPADPQEIDMQQDSPTTLYRFFNAAGDLIYVGITDDLERRLKAHRYKPWWPEVARVETQEYPSRREARRQEVSMILNQTPVYNDCAMAWAARWNPDQYRTFDFNFC